jgi:hypothetical protein
MNSTFRAQTEIRADGSLLVEHTPFHAGDVVELIVTPQAPGRHHPDARYTLRGTEYRYDDPFAPACDIHDWGACQ